MNYHHPDFGMRGSEQHAVHGPDPVDPVDPLLRSCSQFDVMKLTRECSGPTKSLHDRAFGKTICKTYFTIWKA